MNKTIILNFFRKLLFQNSLAEHLLYYFTNGKSLNAFAAKIPPNYYQYPTNSIRKIKRNEINYILDISDYMEWLIYFGIVVEPRKSLYALAKEANVIFDIGANVGYYPMLASRRVWCGWTGACFRDRPSSFEGSEKKYTD